MKFCKEKLINLIVKELNHEDREDTIKSVLSNEQYSKLLKRDFDEVTLRSERRFERAKEKFEKELKVFNDSPEKNGKIVLVRYIKPISSKLESLGY